MAWGLEPGGGAHVAWGQGHGAVAGQGQAGLTLAWRRRLSSASSCSTTLTQVSVIGQLVEQRGHHGVTVHLHSCFGAKLWSQLPSPPRRYRPTGQINHPSAPAPFALRPTSKVGRGSGHNPGSGVRVRAPGLPNGPGPASEGLLRASAGPSVHREPEGVGPLVWRTASPPPPAQRGSEVHLEQRHVLPFVDALCVRLPWLIGRLLLPGVSVSAGQGAVRREAGLSETGGARSRQAGAPVRRAGPGETGEARSQTGRGSVNGAGPGQMGRGLSEPWRAWSDGRESGEG